MVNLWIDTLFAKSLHFANRVYHTKKLKKSWVSNLDRQLKQLTSVFENELFVAKKPPGRPESQRKRAKTNSLKSGKRPKNNIRTSTAKLFFNVKDSF